MNSVRRVLLAGLAAVLVLTICSGGAMAQESADGSIQTDHFNISYEDGNRAEAEEIASYADQYYEVLFQRFGTTPIDGRTDVRVVDDVDCDGGDASGCYKSGVKTTIYLTSDDRSVFYHELIHRFQAKAMEGGTWINPPGTLDKSEVFVEGTARYLQAPDDRIARGTSFRAEDINMTAKNSSVENYDSLALFPEYILHEYGREGFDMLYTTSDPRTVASLSDGDYAELIDDFYEQLPAQEDRMRNGRTPLPGFTYEPFLIEPGDTVTFDARTPDAIEELDRSWYGSQVDEYAWDIDGDGDVDATGPTVTRTLDDPVGREVTLYVTVDGERYEATQRLLLENPPRYRIERVRPVGTMTYDGRSLADTAIIRGDTVEINATLGNTGELTGTQTAELLFEGRVVDSRTVTLTEGDSEAVSLSHTVPTDTEPGEKSYRVRLGDQSTRERLVYLTRKPTVTLEPPTWDSITVTPDIRGGTTAESHVEAGVSVNVSVPTATDTLPVQFTEEMELYLDGRKIDERQAIVTQSPESTTFQMTVPDEPGEYTLRAVMPNEQSRLANSPETTHTLVVKSESEAERIEQTVVGRCGSSGAYCSLEITSVDIPAQVEVNRPTTFAIELKQPDSEPGEMSVAVDTGEEVRVVDGERNDTGIGRVILTVDYDDLGEHEVAVEGTTVATVEVVEEVSTPVQTPTATATPTPTDGSTSESTPVESVSRSPTASATTSSGTGDGFGIAVVVLAIGALASWRLRQRRRE